MGIREPGTCAYDNDDDDDDDDDCGPPSLHSGDGGMREALEWKRLDRLLRSVCGRGCTEGGARRRRPGRHKGAARSAGHPDAPRACSSSLPGAAVAWGPNLEPTAPTRPSGPQPAGHKNGGAIRKIIILKKGVAITIRGGEHFLISISH